MFLPLIHRGDRTNALVIGGGAVALRKVRDLLDAGAKTTLIAPEAVDELERLVNDTGIPWQKREWRQGDTMGYSLVVVATDDAEVNRAASGEARHAGIPVNVVDQPELCTVYFAAVARAEPLLVSVSTGGGAPFLARELKRDLQDWLQRKWARRASWAPRFREFVRDHVQDMEARERLFARFLEVDDETLLRWENEDPEHQWRAWLDGPGD